MLPSHRPSRLDPPLPNHGYSAATSTGTAYLRTRGSDEFAPIEPLIDEDISPRAQLVVVDVDGDGDLDAIWFDEGDEPDVAADGGSSGGSGSSGGVLSVRVALGEASELRASLFKCKFGGSFESRACWDCDDPPAPHQVPAQHSAASASEVRCLPPVLDGYAPLPRKYSGIERVELTFNNQQWTSRLLEYDYVVPWRALSLYPTAGPSVGGTFVQVRASGLYAAATEEPNLEQWRLAFTPADADNSSRLELAELSTALERLRLEGALPEGRLAASALLAASDANADGGLSFDEFLVAQASYRALLAALAGPAEVDNSTNGSAAAATVAPPAVAWAPLCSFGNDARNGTAGWRDGGVSLVQAPLAGEWIACEAPPAAAASADVDFFLNFGEDETGPAREGLQEFAVSRLRDGLGALRPAAVELTGRDGRRQHSLVRGGRLCLTEVAPNTGGTAIIAIQQLAPAAPVSPYFRASLQLYVGGGAGDGGEGLSISYGDIDDGYIDETGAGAGLRLQLRTAGYEQAALLYNGSVLRTTPLPLAAIRGAWRRLEFSYRCAHATFPKCGLHAPLAHTARDRASRSTSDAPPCGADP